MPGATPASWKARTPQQWGDRAPSPTPPGPTEGMANADSSGTGAGEKGDRGGGREGGRGAWGGTRTLQAPLRVEAMEGIVYNRGRVKLSAPAAPGQAAEVDGWCWAHKWRRRRTETRERERQPEIVRKPEIRPVRQTGGGNRREILTSRFIRILMIPVREQDKAKETDIRPEADGGGRQSTGVAGMGGAQQARQSRDGWPGLGKIRARAGPWRGPRRSRLGP